MKHFLTLCLFFTFACSTISPVVCSVESSVAGALAGGVASALSCTNTAQIKSDILGALSKANLCSTSTAAKALTASPLQGPVGDLVCPLAVGAAIGLLSNKVPASWGCAPGASTAGLATTLTSLCEAAVPI
jgi:hypothetical protein